MKNHLLKAHQNKYNLVALSLVVVAMAFIGYFIIHKSHAANADINNDGKVDISDLSILAAHFGQSGQTFSTGDLNADGKVNILDLSLLAAQWGTSSDKTPPTVSISAPSAGATVSGSTTITATASDNVGVTKVEFYEAGTLIATDTTSPYSTSWDTTSVANNTYSLTAKAYDAATNSTISTAVSVTVNNTVTGNSLCGFKTGTPAINKVMVLWEEN